MRGRYFMKYIVPMNIKGNQKKFKISLINANLLRVSQNDSQIRDICKFDLDSIQNNNWSNTKNCWFNSKSDAKQAFKISCQKRHVDYKKAVLHMNIVPINHDLGKWLKNYCSKKHSNNHGIIYGLLIS